MSPPIDIDGSEIQKATIDGQNVNQVTIDGQEVFVSVDIPDSVIHRWPYEEGSGSTAFDTVGTADGTINGSTWLSGTWQGGYALSAAGGSEYISTSDLGNFGSNLDTDFTLASVFRTTDNGAGNIMGVQNDSSFTSMIFEMRVGSKDATNGDVEVSLRDAGDNILRIYTDNNYADGNKHTVVARKVANTGSDAIEFFIDGSGPVPTSVQSDGGFGSGSVNNFSRPLYLMADNSSGSVSGSFNGETDNIQIADTSWTTTEIQNYHDSQPWT